MTTAIIRAMSLRYWARLTGALAFTLAACTPGGAPQPTVTPTTPPILPSTLEPVTPTPSPMVISIWVAPAFAPSPDTRAGSQLAERLAEYQVRHPEVRLEVRIKEASGPAGLVHTLRVTSAAAPAALPDLILLDASGLAEAAAEELIDAYPGELPLPQETDWYPFALEPTRIEGTTYGIASASQAEVLVYDPRRYARPPADWSVILGGPAPFLFPAADPSAAFSLAQYLALDGSLTQDNGSPGMEPAVLEEVLTFYGSAYNAGVLPLTTRQFQDAGQTWKAYNEGRAASAVAPLSAWMAKPGESAAVPLPTREADGTCLTTSWSWAVVTRKDLAQEATVDLVEWLSDPFFLGPWSHALGMLPPNQFALEAWPDGPGSTLAGQLVRIAQPMPVDAVLDVAGPAIQTAVDDVLSGAMSPQEAALQAATEIGGR